MSFNLAKQIGFKKLQKTQFKQGYFSPVHPEKYMGDIRRIIYRSSWELRMMMKFDINAAVIKWSSEETIIPYKSPVDNKTHRYFVDFKLILRTKEGIKTVLVEIKPERQTKPPVKPAKLGKRYMQEVATYITNIAKWEAARKYCDERGFEFSLLTEKNIFDK